ncbi:MAG: S41 family peptidase [Crocinitomicaceae bacterium]|nr:S41 family peptidase [Crocinitomicaceae bacterium]
MENKSNNGYWIPIVMAVCMAVGLFMGNLLTPEKENIFGSGDSRITKLQEIVRILDERYVDDLNGDELFEETIANMLHHLDPHSNYIPAEELQAMNESIQGKFGGVGVRFFIIRDTVCITNVLPGSPALAAGLQAGDKIIAVEGQSITTLIENEDVMGLLKGEEGTDVKMTIYRDGKKLEKRVTRGSIPVESVIASYMITNDIGYVRIDQFSVVTAQEFGYATDVLKAQGMKKIIVDLRNNGGGVLTSATDIVDEFLEGDIPIVETRGEHSAPYIYKSSSYGTLKDIEVAILLNANSASASEILAGAIQDNDRGIIVGRRSFGKGLVQEDFLLRDGSNVRLTIARYYTPTGRCIQTPYTDDYDAYYEGQYDRYDNGEMYEVDSTLFVDSLKFTTPGGRTVYGGGGIMPDVFVPYDTSGVSWYFTELRYSTAFNTFAFDYVQNKRNKWKSAADYNKTFVVNTSVLDQFVAFADVEHNIEFNLEDFNYSKALIKRILKAEIARQLWVEDGYYQVFNGEDEDVQEAIRQLR